MIRLNKPCKIEHCIILCIPSRKSSFQCEFARIKKWKTLVIDEKKRGFKSLNDEDMKSRVGDTDYYIKSTHMVYKSFSVLIIMGSAESWQGI